jgi:limonene-1,2-epoxide hydrolase
VTGASEVVTAFIRAIEAGDLDHALTMVADDIAYDNQPLGPVTGPDEVRRILSGGMSAAAERIEWVVSYQVGEGDVVMNERVDRFLIGGVWLELPVAGLFVLRDGKIALWRDYFDLEGFKRAREKAGLTSPPRGA